jgi:hypothetical protein
MVEELIVPNILVSISSPPKTGKTHLSMSFPKPIKIYSFDQGADSVKRFAFPKDQIDIHNFYMPIIESENPEPWATELWDEFYKEYKKDVEGEVYKTLVIDTATAMETILRQMVLEDKQEDKPNKQKLGTTEYLARNLKMTAIFARARKAGKNLVVIQYLKDKWGKKDGSSEMAPTGELVIDGWNQTEGQVDIVLTMSKKKKGDKTVMITTVKDNRFNRNMEGKSFEDTTYDELTLLTFPEG